jgi:ribosomal protein L19E
MNNSILDRLDKATTEKEVLAIIEKGCIDATPHTVSFLMKVKWRAISKVNRTKTK